MQSDRVTVRISGGVADVRLNRPEKRNALDQAMFEALVDAGQRVADDRAVRAVVLSGEGKSFCAGLDLASFHAMAANAATPVPSSGASLVDRGEGRMTNLAQQAAYTWTELAVPVIAAVHGHALGGGLQIALGADIRIVAPDARLSVLEIRWGLVPDMAGTLMLHRLLPLDVAKELVWTGRMVSGVEAVALGLATRASDDPEPPRWCSPQSWRPRARMPSGPPNACSTSRTRPARRSSSWRSRGSPTLSSGVRTNSNRLPRRSSSATRCSSTHRERRWRDRRPGRTVIDGEPGEPGHWRCSRWGRCSFRAKLPLPDLRARVTAAWSRTASTGTLPSASC